MKEKITAHLKEKYFNNPNKVITLKKGEILMKQNQENKRLFFVLDGLVAGLLDKGDGNEIEIFRSENNMFVGFHSFFSHTFLAYADVVALENSKLAYIERNENEDGKNHQFLEDFTPIIVRELSERQLFAKELMIEKEATLIHNHEKERLVSLGQMASGLAHELNNAIGVINGNSEWIAKEVYNYIKESESPKVFSKFEKGYSKGLYLSSVQVRKQKQSIEKSLKISASSAKKLAKLDFDNEDIKTLRKGTDIDDITDRMYHFWEIGVAIHDILLASKHSVHIINSVKELSVSDRERMEVSVTKSVEQALTLLKKQLDGIAVTFNSEKLATINANNGELVQIWVNLIKNACESMKNGKITNPQLKINIIQKNNIIEVAITDNGPGISKEVKSKIFRPSFTTKKGGLSFGLGLGLPVVQKYVHEYKGEIIIDSKPKQTTFCIKLPLNQ